jgi:septal ring factor EnvC (AmiA/AmiB activator)
MSVSKEERDMVLAAVQPHNEARLIKNLDCREKRIKHQEGVIDYQKEKVSKLRKELAHYQGKFAMVKHENNKLRKKLNGIQKVEGLIKGITREYLFGKEN